MSASHFCSGNNINSHSHPLSCFIAEITHRFQTAKSEVRALLLQCLLPWLENVELVAANVTPATPLSYIMVCRMLTNIPAAAISQLTPEMH